jgi:hypothetical protein
VFQGVSKRYFGFCEYTSAWCQGTSDYKAISGVYDLHISETRRVYSEVSGLAAWSENCKWYSFLPLGAMVSLFCESV